MNPERWQQVEQLYSSALKRKPDQRAAFLSDACRDDSELRREVEALLAQVSETPDDASAWQGTATMHRADSPADAPMAASGSQLRAGQHLGPYRIEAILGVGGMGQVYRAEDTRLGRKVAIKVSAEQFSGRFEREARAISALNHPHICTLYDVGALPSGSTYLVTELVEGETLREWLKRAPSADRGVEIARQVLEALRAAHQARIVHRDLKPANIMVRFDGYVKVLDFGLAKRIKPAGVLAGEDTVTELSVPGQIVGTIAYMSPEQIEGQETGPPSDLFALGIILHEILTGAHPWPRKSTVDTLHAILHDDPPPIRTAALAGLAAVVQKLLRKNPADRYPSAEAALDALASRASSDHQPAHTPHAPTRLIVLPFRLLRRHEASDFLAVSLPDAITSSLAAIDSLVVRSTMAASRFAASTELDVNAIAEQAQVDAILTGTILSDGENLRVSNQLIEAPSGTVLWSNTSQVSLRDIFQLQDELVDRIVQALTLPLTARERLALKHDVPVSAMAYEYYLRANQLAAAAAGGDVPNMSLARDLYLRCVDLDPQYAPAWACLGRAHRFIGKFAEVNAHNLPRAEEAFRKAFALNPDLALAHNFYTSLQTNLGQSLDAMERLLKRAHTHRNDPDLFTGLVQACRYCGLLEASVAAHNHARQLDPNVRTSVAYTYLHLGNFQKVLEHSGPIDPHVRIPSLAALGREQEAIEQSRELEKTCPKILLPWSAMWRAYLEGDRGKSLETLDQALGTVTTDPEGFFCVACLLARLNETERALELLSLAVDQGYRCHYALSCHPWLDSVRSHPRFEELANRAEALGLQARAVFLDNQGDKLLSVTMDRDLPKPAPSSSSLTSIAVLPFVFLSEVEERKALSLGFADALITMLGNLEDVAVTPTSAILKLGGADPAEVSRSLGVRYVLQGNVQKSEAQWRVSVQLFDALTQKISFSEKHDFKMVNVFDVQDEIGRRVGESLQSRFSLAAPKARDRYSRDPEAYGEFMAGLRDSTSNNRETIESSIQHLSEAVERDPDFALAHATLSYMCTTLHFNFDPQRTWMEKAEHHCERALALDPALPEAHLARSWILWSPDKNFQHADAIAALEQVLTAQPNFERAHNRMSNICWHIGRMKEARIAHEMARRSNPKTKTQNLEYIELYGGEFSRAEEVAKAWLAEEPGNVHVVNYSVQCALVNGDLDLAAQRVGEIAKSSPDDPFFLSLKGLLHARRNQAGAALECVRLALESPRSFGHIHHSYHQIAGVYAILEDTQKALAWMERTVDTGFPCWSFFRIDPHLENLRELPAFKKLLTGLERKYTALKISRL